MYLKSPIFIGLLFLLFSGFFSANSYAVNACSYMPPSMTLYGQATGSSCASAIATHTFHSDWPCTETTGACPSTYQAPCPAAGTPYSGYVPASSPPSATGTTSNPNDPSGSTYCGVTIDASKSSCPPNTVMPVFGTVATPACIVSGTYTGSSSAGGASVTSPPKSSTDCPTGSGSYSISNGTTTVSGCAKTASSTSSNPAATPAATTKTGTNATSTTTTNSSSSTTPNSTTGGSNTVGTSTTTNTNSCGGAGQPACNVNSTCGGAGQPACNTNIGDSTFVVATPSLITPNINDKAQGTVTGSYSITNYTNASASGCPITDQSASVFGYSITIPFAQICQYMDWVHYIVIVAAAIAAMKLL